MEHGRPEAQRRRAVAPGDDADHHGSGVPCRRQPILDADEFLPRGTGSRPANLGFLNLAPIVIIGRHDAAVGKQAPNKAADTAPTSRTMPVMP